MAEDMGSNVATAGIETAKGAVKGLFFVPFVAATVGAVLVGAVASLVFSAVPMAVLGAAILGGAGAGGVMAALEVFAAPVALPVTAAIGGVMGLAKGGQKISKENQMAARSAVMSQGAQAERDQQAYMAGMQARDQQVQDMLPKVIEQVRQQTLAEVAQQQPQAEAPEKSFAANVGKTGGNAVEKLAAERAAAQAQGQGRVV